MQTIPELGGVGLEAYLALAAVLFVLGLLGIVANRRSAIRTLLSLELMLLSVNINVVAFSAHHGDLVGWVFTLVIGLVAVAGCVIGFAILVCIYRLRGTTDVTDVSILKG
ncbi:MAG: NADH-quinone oxidoreductase subunit NuoK [Pseudomonadota bacterium]